MFGNLLKKNTQGLGDHVGDLRRLTVDYAKQETLEPLKGLIRYLIFGLAGTVCLGIGLTLWIIGGLRALQTETGTTFTGNWSWAPYFIVLAVTGLLIGLAVSAIGKERRAADRRKLERQAGAQS